MKLNVHLSINQEIIYTYVSLISDDDNLHFNNRTDSINNVSASMQSINTDNNSNTDDNSRQNSNVEVSIRNATVRIRLRLLLQTHAAAKGLLPPHLV